MSTEDQEPEGVIPEDDLLKALRASEGTVLVGGQALAFWVARFQIDIGDAPRVYISVDADFLGRREHVGRFSRAIGGKAIYPPKRGLTALHGAVEKSAKSGKIGVDVLHKIVGLDAGAVQERAIEVTHPGDPSLHFRVMDPIDCLVSRLENLRQLAEKKNEIGRWQAAIAILVCKAYLEELVRLGEEKKAIKAATAIFRLAGSAPGLQAFTKYRLDILEAVPVEHYLNENFKREQARRSFEAIRQIREDMTQRNAQSKTEPSEGLR